jgi:predicted ATP-binding protein involved in virulence
VASLFDETVSLVDAVDWLVEQRLFELEKRPSAANLISIVKSLLNDGLLPDNFEVSGVTSDGLLIAHQGAEFALRDMSDGYRAVTALVVDIVRQMHLAYRGQLGLKHDNGVPTLPYPGVILIDEVDAHLHVSWQKRIGGWLKAHFPEIQFIVTTHSPYICQSADPGGLILLPGPGEDRPPEVIDDDLYQRVVYGSGDDAVLSAVFGVDTAYSPMAEKLRQRLTDLEIKILDGSASDQEKAEYKELSRMLASSLNSRVNEVIARFGLEN